MDIWFFVGLGLLLWALRDLIAGSTYLLERVTRSENPGKYWFGVMLWLVVALAVVFLSPTTNYLLYY
ncbi:hypothetical protein [Ruegeria sp. R14_0]|uniref:hypothetical protein n=1 Tax=Ruegeria sp. R14_0 TaxID=2821100 RepID=UPI001ADC2A22|nr:hypothetical protein [Ruegeria sp. R14_0]MBO9446668.1 hypothetical protein [Ruegeria sp. R14_0]